MVSSDPCPNLNTKPCGGLDGLQGIKNFIAADGLLLQSEQPKKSEFYQEYQSFLHTLSWYLRSKQAISSSPGRLLDDTLSPMSSNISSSGPVRPVIIFQDSVVFCNTCTYPVKDRISQKKNNFAINILCEVKKIVPTVLKSTCTVTFILIIQ